MDSNILYDNYLQNYNDGKLIINFLEIIFQKNWVEKKFPDKSEYEF